MRLVSLLPSATEIVYALGLGDQLVGVTSECDEPPAARVDKTVVVGGLDTRGMTAREIDQYVHGRLAADGNLYTMHEQAPAELQPDLTLTQDLCAVCALPSGQVEAALGTWAATPTCSPWIRARWSKCWTRSWRWARPLGCPARPGGWWPGCAPGSPPWHLALRGGPGRRSRWSSGWTRRSPPGTGCPTW